MFKNRRTTSGQSSIEFIIVLGFIIIPALTIGMAWAKTEWNQNECAFQSFKTARIRMIQTQKRTNVNGIEVLPLEDLDQNKDGLIVSDLLKEVSQLWEQLSSSSHS